MASIPMPRRITPMLAIANLVLVSRIQELNRRITHTSFGLPLL